MGFLWIRERFGFEIRGRKRFKGVIQQNAGQPTYDGLYNSHEVSACLGGFDVSGSPAGF